MPEYIECSCLSVIVYKINIFCILKSQHRFEYSTSLISIGCNAFIYTAATTASSHDVTTIQIIVAP